MKLKKAMVTLAACLMAATGVAGMDTPVWVMTAKGEAYSGLMYEVQDDGTVEITGCDSDLGFVIIPDTIDGRTVTSIDTDAFKDHTALESITIPDTVTVIGFDAFYGCTNLASVTLPKNLGVIAGDAFCDCTSLTGIVIPDGVREIGVGAFCRCTSLQTVYIPSSVTEIGTSAFYNCASLTEVVVPANVTQIGNAAFSCCTNLQSITLLNPDCAIQTSYTICNDLLKTSEGTELVYSGVIRGYEDSTAQQYAKVCGYTFVSLGLVPYSTGDVDGDGDVDAVDASLLLRASAFMGTQGRSGLEPEQEAAADVDGKNGFNAVDASYILQYAAYRGNSSGSIKIKDFVAGR